MHVDESHSTLRFACRAKRVVNNATVNEVLSDAAVLKRQAKEIEELRKVHCSQWGRVRAYPGKMMHSVRLDEQILRAHVMIRDELWDIHIMYMSCSGQWTHPAACLMAMDCAACQP